MKAILAICFMILNVGLFPQSIYSYKYDSKNRVIESSSSNCTAIKYQYDNDGNRIGIQKSQIIVTPTITNTPCYGTNQGSISLQSTNGNNYGYQWSNNRTGSVNTSLTAGTYTVTITDATLNNTCTRSYIVEQPAPITINIVARSIPCNGGHTGSAYIDTTNFSPLGFRLTWPNGSHGLAVQNMAAGTYNLTVADSASNCTQTVPFAITQVPSFIASVISDSISCYGANDGYAAITVTGNFTDYTFHWTTGNTTNSESNLTPGPKVITVMDTMRQCAEQVIINIFEPAQVLTTAQILPSCENIPTGSVLLSTTGGVSPYKYSFDSSSYQLANSFNSLLPNQYRVVTRDSKYCTDTLIANVSSKICNTAIITASDSGYVKVYPSPNSGMFFVEFSSSKSGQYTIEITNNLGQVINTIFKAGSGEIEKMPVDLTSEPTGIYLIKLMAPTYSAIKSVEVIH